MRGSPEKKHIIINGLRLHYLEWNKEGGLTMILLHGTGDNAHIWDHFASSVPNHFRIIALDQRGHGEREQCWNSSRDSPMNNGVNHP